MNFQPGLKIIHPEYGSGVVLESSIDGYVRVFFGSGERKVPQSSLSIEESRRDRILRNVSSSSERLRIAHLVYQSYALPIMDSAASLTSAKIDLLPHQVVLTHRIAIASPRRFLIADEVGLGKTIETALILRELASRGELNRALMIVPAGLVNNWHRELNEVFHLNFEIFGSGGDITDRKSNAFSKHDKLIASVDTLKRPTRLKKILEAPKWDLIVFDEAHHLTAERNGAKVRKTENYKLAEALKNHTRDLLLLSATPHQGNHFRFWMLIQLLNPGLFNNSDEMVENRHRLNSVIFRRTKADACKPDGSTLFARRFVNTESVLMHDEERVFYEELREYLDEGFDLARRKGAQGRALGFLMAIFQKIAASSFAAVRRTLRKRYLMLTLHEAYERDKALDVENREKLLNNARLIVHEDYAISSDIMGKAEVERILSDLKYKLVKRLNQEELDYIEEADGSEFSANDVEDFASWVMDLALPEERSRIEHLLQIFPKQKETKVTKLLEGLSILWNQNPNEKIVIFATYLGTVDLLSREIELNFPNQKVVVLRGGDHSSKLTAERKFKRLDGPNVMVCTAAGREGINLQFSRILFNFDLPWNPMDLEQRIGRIHRYGQVHTAQVYNLVLSDTIEGRIFLLLQTKLEEIARTLGKVDELGNISEDLEIQILGQLSERLNYNKLYQDALSDPELKRTELELAAAISNSTEARKVVFDLFQDLDGFSLDDYKPYADTKSGMEKILAFMTEALKSSDQRLIKLGENSFNLINSSGEIVRCFTTDRETANDMEGVDLIGLDHPLVQSMIDKFSNYDANQIGCSITSDINENALLTIWQIDYADRNGDKKRFIQTLATSFDGRRLPVIEHKIDEFFSANSVDSKLKFEYRKKIIESYIEPALQRELRMKGIAKGEGSYTILLIGYLEIYRNTFNN